MKENYENIFIIDSKALFESYKVIFDIKNDLFLTYDFALKKYIIDLGGNAEYLDHIVGVKTMEDNNYLIYKFFKDWHYDKDGNDIFTFKDVSFGFSFRLEFWNDFVSFIRIYLSLKKVFSYSFKKLYVGTLDKTIIDILNNLGIDYETINYVAIDSSSGYYFPITKWLNSKIKPKGVKGFLYKVREKVSYYYGTGMIFFDKLFSSESKFRVFIQEYHPTRKIIQLLRNDNKFVVILENFSRFSNKRDNMKERLLPITGNLKKYENIGASLLKEFDRNKFYKLVLSDNSDITDFIYKIIIKNISERITSKLRTLDSCIKYLDNNSLNLVILIANIGHTSTLFDLACQSRKIPSYLIVNGLLLNNYQDEAKYATYINAYSKSIKENYFKDMDNIVALGDPRMDMYADLKQKKINRDNPTVTIGTSGFNPTDLNSYVAVEFDFMYDILQAFSILKANGEECRIVIKVRPNGYLEQYKEFVKDYFQDLEVEYIITTPMIDVLKKTDFYISICSQTLFEASCLGIPVVYYKNDTEILNAPFDNNSELVIITKIEEMIQAYYDFKSKHSRYESFLNKKVMEQYIGPLDGNNLSRNIDFIYSILNKRIHSDI